MRRRSKGVCVVPSIHPCLSTAPPAVPLPRRLLTTGSIEEKVFQRQLAKQGLSEALVDDCGWDNRHFSKDDLRDLFRVSGGSSSIAGECTVLVLRPAVCAVWW